MSRFETTLTVARDIEPTFDFVSDFRHAKRWDPRVAEALKVTRGPIGIGSSFHLVSRLGLVDFVQPYEVVVFDRPFRIALRGRTWITRYEDSLLLRSVAEGTEIEYVADLSLTGVLCLGWPLTPLLVQWIGPLATRGMKAAVERGVPPGPSREQ